MHMIMLRPEYFQMWMSAEKVSRTAVTLHGAKTYQEAICAHVVMAMREMDTTVQVIVL